MISKVVVIVERSMFLIFGIFVIQIIRKPHTGTVKNASVAQETSTKSSCSAIGMLVWREHNLRKDGYSEVLKLGIESKLKVWRFEGF